MADTKISALPAATTPLDGTEVLPIVQGGITEKVSVANLTAGRAISATQLTLSTGNLIVANGQGIDFSATPGTGTSELFADYEEGTWTPNQGAGLTVVGAFSSTGRYTKIGRQVFIQGKYTGATSISVSGGGVMSTNLPFTVGTSFEGGGTVANAALSVATGCIPAGTSTIMYAVGNNTSTTVLYFNASYTV